MARRSGLVPRWHHLHRQSYKAVVKLTFAKGASLKDPAKLFNSSLEGNTWRAIDIHENEEIDEKAFATLIRAAIAFKCAQTARVGPSRFWTS